MNKKYCVLFLGLLKDQEDFKQNMTKLGVSSETADMIVQKAPVVLKGNLTLGHAREYADAIQDAGGRVKLKAHGVFEEVERGHRHTPIKSFGQFVMCPQCGFKQLKAEVCVKCGFRL